TLADLDANGKPEVLVTHPVGRYTPSGASKPVSTGALTLLSLELVAPDPATINPLDPTTAIPKPRFVATHDPIADFEPTSSLEAEDLNNDGKLDLIASTSDGLRLYRNIGTSSKAFSLRFVRACTPVDFDGDGDADVLAWDSQGPALYRNRLQASGEGDHAGLDLLSE